MKKIYDGRKEEKRNAPLDGLRKNAYMEWDVNEATREADLGFPGSPARRPNGWSLKEERRAFRRWPRVSTATPKTLGKGG